MALSEGEAFIVDYFKKTGITYRWEHKIDRLKNDSKSFRMADFYLPRFKVYVEFFGQWNVPEQKERYKEKMRVYASNNIPVVYIFPENLGVFDYIFRARLLKVLRENKMKWQIVRYKFLLFGEEFFYASIMMSVALAIILLAALPPEDRDMLAFICFCIAFLCGMYLFFRAIIKAVRI